MAPSSGQRSTEVGWGLPSSPEWDPKRSETPPSTPPTATVLMVPVAVEGAAAEAQLSRPLFPSRPWKKGGCRPPGG